MGCSLATRSGFGGGGPVGGGRPGFRDGDSGSGIASRSAARAMRGQQSPVASTRISGYRAVATAGQAGAVTPGSLPISHDGSAPGNGKRHGQNRMAMTARPKSNDDEGAFLPNVQRCSMSGSKVISVLDTEMLAVNGGTGTPQETASATAAAQTFAPSVWGDFFATYTPPNSKRSEEWTRGRAEGLKVQVRSKLLKAKSSSSAADMVMLVDTLERLGIDNHFRHEIAAMLHRVHREQQGCTAGSDDDDDLHITSLQFRLLRKHGFRVSAAVFDKFIDSKGSFRASLSSDTRGLLSLYNAAHMAMPGEEGLDDAIAFARHHLRSIQGKLRLPMAEQVSRALDIPLPRAPRRLETVRYIAEYEHEPAFDGVALELAKLDFELVRSLHLRELKALTL
ncbi:inactive beta selinene synthase [Oryza sativa Japonica Group]|uniref:inactive beta selinene synthase n=1 Tax=Oryza sativa subsp. japonica TaxID=39947 RepID=UPI0007754B4F|nr:beta-sesquiphellandrene synthase [Oryza sativa Japonica Group]